MHLFPVRFVVPSDNQFPVAFLGNGMSISGNRLCGAPHVQPTIFFEDCLELNEA